MWKSQIRRLYHRQFDISKIDFDLLSREFAHTRRKNLLLRDLDELVNQQLAKMLVANPQRIDYYDRYQEIIDAYNAEQNRKKAIEKTFMDLMNLQVHWTRSSSAMCVRAFPVTRLRPAYDLLFFGEPHEAGNKRSRRCLWTC